jgi:hypothetical protein
LGRKILCGNNVGPGNQGVNRDQVEIQGRFTRKHPRSWAAQFHAHGTESQPRSRSLPARVGSALASCRLRPRVKPARRAAPTWRSLRKRLPLAQALPGVGRAPKDARAGRSRRYQGSRVRFVRKKLESRELSGISASRLPLAVVILQVIDKIMTDCSSLSATIIDGYSVQ